METHGIKNEKKFVGKIKGEVCLKEGKRKKVRTKNEISVRKIPLFLYPLRTIKKKKFSTFIRDSATFLEFKRGK
jgi:hypothetical protein